MYSVKIHSFLEFLVDKVRDAHKEQSPVTTLQLREFSPDY